MPAKSKAFRRLAAIAEHHPGEVYAKNKGVLKMTHEQLHDFASTREKGLPNKVRHTIKGNRGAEKPKPGSGMAYSKGSSIFGVPKDIANKDGYSAAGHENRGKNKSLKGKGGHPGEGHKGHSPGNANAYRDGHGGTLDKQKRTHDGFGEAGHTKRHTFHKIGHRDHHIKMSVG